MTPSGRNPILIFLGLLIVAGLVWWLMAGPGNRLEQARTAYFTGDYAAAVEHYEAIGRDQLDQENLRFLADSYRQQHLVDQATDVEVLLQVQFGDDSAELVRQANLALAAGDQTGAIANYEAAIAAQPVTTDAYVGLATAHAAAGALEEAYAAFERGIIHDEIAADLLLRLAEFALAQGDEPRALAAYDRVLAFDPANPAARDYLNQHQSYAEEGE